MKKRTKKYNPRKVALIGAEHNFKNYVFLMDLSVTSGYVRMLHKTKLKQVVPSEAMYELLMVTPFNWSFVLVVDSTESNGKKRKSTQFVQSPYPATQTELVKSLNKQHQDMIAVEQSRHNEVYNAAWVAVPYPLGKLSDEQKEAFINECVEYLEVLYG